MTNYTLNKRRALNSFTLRFLPRAKYVLCANFLKISLIKLKQKWFIAENLKTQVASNTYQKR